MKKLCIRCRTRHPNAGDSFPADATSPDGFADICHGCLNQVAADQAHARNARLAAQLDDHLALEAAKTLAVPPPAGPDDQIIPDTTTLYGAIVKGLGGVEGIANLWRAQFLASKPGSPTRTKMLDSLVKQSIFVTEQGSSRQLADLDQNELKALLAAMEKRIEATMAKRVIYTEAIPTEPVSVESVDNSERTAHEVPCR